MMFIVQPGGEKQRIRRGVCNPKTELERPNSGDLNWCAARVGDLAQKRARVEVERVDGPITKVADEKRIVEAAETFKWRPGHSPGRVELTLTDEPLQQVAFGVKNVEEAVSGTLNIVMLIRVLYGVSNVKFCINGCDSKRRVTGRKVLIAKSAMCMDGTKAGVEHIHRAGTKVGG